jgi:hypothetical protein
MWGKDNKDGGQEQKEQAGGRRAAIGKIVLTLAFRVLYFLHL